MKLLLVVLCACDGAVSFSQADIDKADLGAGLGAGFWFGAATAPHQVEGGLENDWSEWERTPGHIKDGSVSGRAANSWEQWPEDVAALQTLGANAYRMGVEWSRIEPQEGVFDDAALARYRAMIVSLRSKGIEPVVTLWHFTLPKWLAARGGWEAADADAVFANYVTRVAEALGDVVDTWVTVNEPNVYAVQGYGDGTWPPGVRDNARQTRVMMALLKAHLAASRALRKSDARDADGDGKATFIGLAHHVRLFQSASFYVLDQSISGLTDDYFNEAIPRALRTGRVLLSVPGSLTIDERVEGLAASCDFLGLNYYTRDYVRTELGTPSLSAKFVPSGRPTNDLGWDIYPEGLFELLIRFSRDELPLIITENGVADRDDSKRPAFLRAHVYAVEQAVKKGVRVKGYLHWSLLDNFEWAEGYDGRFGLFSVDFADPALPRVARPSVDTFRRIADRHLAF